MDPVADVADLWRLTTEHSPIGMALVGLDGRWLLCNQALSDMLGYSAEDLTRLDFQTISHPDDLHADLVEVERLLTGRIDSFRLRKRYLHASGRIVWGDLSVALARGADGAPRHFVSQILDVSDEQVSQERLEAAVADVEHERRILEAIFETVGVGLLLIDQNGHYERMNRRHAETMRLAFPDGHAGQAGQLGEVYHLDGTTMMGKEEMPSYRATQGEDFDDIRYWVGSTQLTRAAFSVSARQVRLPSGERIGAALAYEEITDLMLAIQAKDQFVASVSHELRTPLTSVLGHLELLVEREDVPKDVVGQLEVVQRNANRLRALVSDLLQVAQAREGSLQLHRAEVDLVVLAREGVDALHAAAERDQVALEVAGPDTLVVEVDEQRIRQVIDNLLTNAVKYTEAGGTVRIALRRTDDSVALDVSDTGIGIAEHEIDRVFTRFFRGGGAMAQQIPGTGLGLNIVSSIVRAHGGTVTLESKIGQGSTFHVNLPIAGS